MLCALSVAFLWLSGILPLSTYFWPILASAALLFCFLGYYPLLKPKIDAISSKVLRLLLKVALCTVSMGLMYALIIFVFKLPAVVQEFSETAAWLLWVTAATGLALFFLYDIAIDRLSFLYCRRRGKKA